MQLRLVLAAALVFASALRAAGQPAPSDMPPDIAAIVGKMQRGEKPTAAELEKLKRWGKRQGAGGGGGKGAGKEVQRPTLAELGLCPGKPRALTAAVPTRGEYVALAKATAAKTRRKSPQGAAKVDDVVAASSARAAASLALPALARGGGALATYATARGAEKDPADPQVANNLGVLLTGAGDLAGAERVLLYADSLRPNQPLITVNRAWNHFHAGDAAGARQLFQRALQQAPELASPRLGLGLLAGCGGGGGGGGGGDGDPVPLLRESLARHPSPAGTMAVEALDTLSPAPFRHPDALELPPLPLSRELAKTPQDYERGKPMGDALMKRLAERGPYMVSMNRRIQELHAQKRDGNGQNEWYAVLHEPYIDAVTAEDKRFDAAVQPLVQGFMSFLGNQFQSWAPRRAACNGDSRCEKQVEYDMCLEAKRRAETDHPKVYEVITASWGRAKGLLDANWVYSRGMLGQFQDPAWIDMLSTLLEYEVVAHHFHYVAIANAWAGLVAGVVKSKCVPPPPPPEPGGSAKPLPEADQEGKCPLGLPSLDIDTGAVLKGGETVTLEVKCFTVKVELKSGKVGGGMFYLEVGPTDNFLDLEMTVFAGAFAGGELPDDMGEAEVRLGVYSTLEGDKGPVGAGIEGEGTLIGPKGAGVEGQFQLNGLALQSGPPADGEKQAKFFEGTFTPKFAIDLSDLE